MLGAIAGDIIGSLYEFKKIPPMNFKLFKKDSRFTDDTVLTVALADSLMNKKDWRETLLDYYEKYPKCGFGGGFIRWAKEKSRDPYNSYGNGSSMRVSPIGWICNNLEDVLRKARISSIITHDNPEGIRGAQAIASSIFLARKKKLKVEIEEYIEKNFFGLNFTYEEIRELISSVERSQACRCLFSVPPAIKAFLDSSDFESAIRLAISVGGDSDTIACMAGSIAEAYYGVPEVIKEKVYKILDPKLRKIVDKFYKKYMKGNKICL